MGPISVVIYIWVSDGPLTSTHLRAAENRCRAYAARYCWSVVDVCTDTGSRESHGCSGENPETPVTKGLAKALAHLRQGEATIMLTDAEEMIGATREVRPAVAREAEQCEGFIQVAVSP